ncbi:MAG: hypothetical protein QMB65_04395 [Vicingaceae bacterium]
MLFGCESGIDHKLKVYGDALGKVRDNIKEVKKENSTSRKVMLHQFETKSLMLIRNIKDVIEHPESHFELRDKSKIIKLKRFLETNRIKRYSCDMSMMERCGSLSFGELNYELGIHYDVNENWLNDSVVFVPSGYQSYVSMTHEKWAYYLNIFSKIKSKKYKISHPEKAVKIHNYIKGNDLNAIWKLSDNGHFSPLSNLDWLNHEGRFSYRLEPGIEDYIGNKEEMKLKRQYPKDKFNVAQWCTMADLNKEEYTYEIIVYCSKEFYKKFSKDYPVGDWVVNKGFLQVFADSSDLLIIDSISSYSRTLR